MAPALGGEAGLLWPFGAFKELIQYHTGRNDYLDGAVWEGVTIQAV
ncbi:MAG: hypothetical protein PHD76_02665 [Methylacidiphilales bacterium]|nr:hypothetical protein [Candidatus Methylacidiphilales bacterium]